MIDKQFLQNHPECSIVACKTANSITQYRLYDQSADELSGISLSLIEARQIANGRPILHLDTEALRQRQELAWHLATAARLEERDRVWTNEQLRREAYYRAPQWRARRAMTLARDRYTCKAQLPGCTSKATDVHHKTYKHLYNEPLFDLESVCRHCHEALHASEKEHAIAT